MDTQQPPLTLPPWDGQASAMRKDFFKDKEALVFLINQLNSFEEVSDAVFHRISALFIAPGLDPEAEDYLQARHITTVTIKAHFPAFIPQITALKFRIDDSGTKLCMGEIVLGVCSFIMTKVNPLCHNPRYKVTIPRPPSLFERVATLEALVQELSAQIRYMPGSLAAQEAEASFLRGVHTQTQTPVVEMTGGLED